MYTVCIGLFRSEYSEYTKYGIKIQYTKYSIQNMVYKIQYTKYGTKIRYTKYSIQNMVYKIVVQGEMIHCQLFFVPF